ncbi:MAG: spermidine synthase [Rhodospirillales bacterium]|nr:MAG: spermidine synthase [Rhodospirillales bacterium]
MAGASTDARFDRNRFVTLALLFFISGASALVYQTAWHRMLGLFAGADSISAALVVGAFLLGLGLGSLAAGLRADALGRRRALLLFAVCEIGIAVFAALSPWLFHDVVHARLAPLAESRLAVFAVVFAGLLWPTFLMGCSLPLLGRAVVDDIARSARQIGWLYGLNTLGAGIGALAAGWVVIGLIGYAGAVYLAACLNVVVAAGGWWLARGVTDDGAAPRPAAARPAPSDGARVAMWCALVFVSGFLIVGLQIVWYRLMGVLMQSNAYGFSLVLGVFLVGDAVGLLVGARTVDRIRDPLAFFLGMQAATLALALAGIGGLLHAVGAGWIPGDFVERDIVTARAADIALLALLTALIVLPGSFVMGFSFPVVQRAVQTDIGAVGRRVGLVQLANILGNSAGSLVTGLVALHTLGTAGTLRALGAVALLFGAAALARLGATGRVARLPGVATTVVAILLFTLPSNAAFWERLHTTRAGERVWVSEDRTGLAVLRLNAKEEGRLYIQGHSQSCLPFCTVHAFLGAIGPLAHPDPKDVLVIGIGSGGTPYSAGLDPRVRKVRAIEIVEPVLDDLRRYAAGGGKGGVDALLREPRFEIVVADGRRALSLDAARYDVIEADAILPKSSLSGLLYSREFFEQVRSRLKPGGLYVQWAPTERSVATFRAVFPHVVMVHPALIGSDSPITYDPEAVRARLADPEVRARLAAARIDAVELASWFRDKKPEILNAGAVASSADLNTDLFPKDEYYLNRGRSGDHGPK